MRPGFLGFFTSCFHKRQDRSRVKTLQQQNGSEESSGTDDSCGDPTPQSRFQPPPTARVQPNPPPGHHQPEKPVAVPPAVNGPATKGEDMDKIKSRAKWLHKSKAKSVV